MTHDAGAAAPASDLPAAVQRPRFARTGTGSAGYRVTEVDRFVDRALAALGEDPPALAPEDVVRQRFGVVRLRAGYDLRQVDDWVDRVLAELLRRRPAARHAAPPPSVHHVRTWWIYAVALVLVAAIVVFAATQL